MPLDPNVLGQTSEPRTLKYDWQTVALYALGIGARRDELDTLYEGAKGGMKVHPTFAVVPAYEPVLELLGKTGGNMAMVVHGAQTVRLHRPLAPSGSLVTQATVKGVYDMKKFAQVVIETRSEQNGEPVFETVWSILFRGEGSFGGPRPPDSSGDPTAPKDREPDWVVSEATSPEQALLYRLSGDLNPLHADPEFAEKVGFAQGPILHGLCTYGFAARAIVKKAAGGDHAKLRSFSAQFRKPVWPGETLVTRGFELGGGKVAVVTSVEGRPDAVLGGAWAEIG